MRSQDTRPDPGPASDIAGTVEEDFAHLLSCWPQNHLNGETRRIARWCGWTYEEALARLSRLAQAGAIVGGDRWQSPINGAWIVLWPAPVGAHGLPPVEGERAETIAGCTHQAPRGGRGLASALAASRRTQASPTHPHQLGFAEVARG